MPFACICLDLHLSSSAISAKKITFSRLSLSGRHRNYSILHLKFELKVESHGTIFGTWRYFGNKELARNAFFWWMVHAKTCNRNYSKTNGMPEESRWQPKCGKRFIQSVLQKSLQWACSSARLDPFWSRRRKWWRVTRFFFSNDILVFASIKMTFNVC